MTLQKKVCLLGDFAVGKTSLVRRFVYDLFDDKYISTIGVRVSRKTLVVPHRLGITELTMMLWDLAGNEEFSQIRLSYLRGVSGAVLVCDLTREETFESLHTYIQLVRDTTPDAHLVLAVNKSDLADERQITREQVEVTAEALDIPYYLTSAKSGSNVEEAFRHLGQFLVRRDL
ncbi:MAG TPA: GTP-binding protein [Chloroflexi bacterium]|nr:GTP-binding protein [Chloroflexota bacterium]